MKHEDPVDRGALHPVLVRQILRAGIKDLDVPVPPEKVRDVFQRVTLSYQGADEDRYLLERSLSISSAEMHELNGRIQAERDRLDAVLAASGDAICTLSDDGAILWSNPVARQILELGDDIQSSEFRFFEAISDPPAEQEGAFPTQLHLSNHHRVLLSTAKGKTVPISFIRSSLNAQSDVGQCVIVFRNITAELAHEHELEDARQKARVADRAKSEFLANVSHEIRTPMNGVLGMAQLLARTELTAEQRDYVAHLRSSAEGLMQILNDLLDISKIEANKFKVEDIPFRLSTVLDETCAVLSGQAEEKDLSFNVELSHDVPNSFSGDAKRIRQVLINLGSNAIKFTHSGSVRLLVSCPDPHVSPVTVNFDVVDSGIGISPEQQQLIFEPFVQADSSTTRLFGGTGLGLAICKRLTSLMGGQLTLTSEVGVGSSFRLAIPMQTVKMSDQAAAASPAPGALAPMRILLAEDNRVNQVVASKLLKRLGHTVTLVENGRQAVETILGGTFDIVLMDDQMPEISGTEATRQLRQMGMTIPIIGLSASAMVSDRERFLEAGMTGFVPKPFVLESLNFEMRRVLDARPKDAVLSDVLV